MAAACAEVRHPGEVGRGLSTGPRSSSGPGSVRRVTIWIDPPAWPAHGRLWSHLVSDTSYDELHDFAVAQGIPRRGFEGDHYDVPEERYAALVAAGAAPVGGRELVRILQRSGLRIQKRQHERVVQAMPGAPWLPMGSRADVIASRQDDARRRTRWWCGSPSPWPGPARGGATGRWLGPADAGGGAQTPAATLRVLVERRRRARPSPVAEPCWATSATP